MKKIIFAVLSVVILIGGGIGLFVGLKDKGTQDLSVRIQDITIHVGQSQEIDYECSNDDAIISFEIENVEVAAVEYISNIPTVRGVSAGTTKITIFAKYKKFSNHTSATIVVTDDGDNESVDITIELEARANVDEVNGMEITCTKSTTAYVGFVVYDIDVDDWAVSAEDENVNVGKFDAQPYVMWITSSVAGEYVVKLTINGTYEVEINVLVNE